MKLAQNQMWRSPTGVYFRIVHLERLEVQFKEIPDIRSPLGRHHHVSKKEFCRLLQGAELLTPDQVRDRMAG